MLAKSRKLNVIFKGAPNLLRTSSPNHKTPPLLQFLRSGSPAYDFRVGTRLVPAGQFLKQKQKQRTKTYRSDWRNSKDERRRDQEVAIEPERLTDWQRKDDDEPVLAFKIEATDRTIEKILPSPTDHATIFARHLRVLTEDSQHLTLREMISRIFP